MSQHKDLPVLRPESDMLTDLAVYVVPPELWRENLHSAVSDIDVISAGFLRVHPETLVTSLREEIENQLSEDFDIPQTYVFLKNIGKCLTKVRHKQEVTLKVKNFIAPGPSAFVPEIYLLEGGSDSMSIHPSSVSSYRSEAREDPYQLNSFRGKQFSNQKPIPPIQSGYSSQPIQQNGGYRNTLTPPPLSTSPPHSPPQRMSTRDNDNRESLPPLSATPSPTFAGEDRIRMINGKSQYEDNRFSAPSPVVNDQRVNSALLRQAAEDERRRKQEEDERAEEERRRKRRAEEEEHRKTREEDDRRRREEEERRRREEEEKRRESEERRRREEEDRKRRDEEERKRKQKEYDDEESRKRLLQDDERRRKEDEERRRREGEDRARRAEDRARMDAEAQQQNSQYNEEKEKEELRTELERLRDNRRDTERQREDLVKRAKQLQSKTQNKRNQARDVWKKKYFEEKKKSPPLEDQCTKLRLDLETLHKRIVNTMEGAGTNRGAKNVSADKPSPQSNVKIQAARLQHEIEDLQRRVETVKMKLTAEMKLRNQAEVELRALRAELTQKKINVTLARSKQQQHNDGGEMYTPRGGQQPLPLTSRS